MFGRVLDEMIEPFSGSPSTPETAGTRKIQSYFSEILPNIVHSNDQSVDLVKLTEVSNTRIASNQDILRKKWIQTDNNKQLLLQKEADCRNTNGLDPFGKLVELNATQDPSSRLRCGWIYNKTNPNLGGGALGMLEGPISSKAPGVWNWDLKLATEQMHVDICKDIQDCTDIDRPSLKQRCGWCERLQKAVPITKAGKVAYPWNKVGGCPASNTVTRASKCPANPPPDENEETPPEPCDPLADGRMSRACVLSKYVDAGCSEKGAIGRALATGTDHDYMNSLYSQKAFKVFQERSSLNLNVNALKNGKMSMTDASNEFDRLSAAATAKSSGGGALDHAIRDLCLNQGEIEKFDFCTELTNSSVGPYTIDCLQKAFIRAGGQKDGSKYPSTSTIAYWNTFSNWKSVLAEMQKIRETTGSSDSTVKYVGTKELINANTADPFKCATTTIPRNITFSRGNVVARLSITQDYKLEFDITPRSTVGGWGSIFHFTSDGGNCCTPGQRSPAIWFVPGGLGLHVRVGDTADGNWGYDNVAGCQIGKKSHIILECKGKEVKLTVDATVHNAIQPTVRYSGPVIVYASDPWHDIPNAKIENVCFQPYGNSTTIMKCDKGLLPAIYSPSQGKVLAQNLIMTQDFKLTMDITPRGTVGHWGSIIHFTTGRDCCDFGHRAPGIWFAPNTIDTFALHIGYANDGGWAARPSGMPFQIGKTTRLELLCRGEKITITVDKKVYNYTHDSYRYSGPVTVYGGNPWYPPANCTIMNVCLETYGNPIQPFTCPTTLLPKSYVPRANTILANNITMTQDFILQFDITPRAIVGNWGSIIHFTTGADCCGFGQRAPGIWFWPGTLELLFVVSDSQHGNFYPTGKFEGCSMNKKSRVVMVCKGKEVTISVDDKVKKFTQPTHRYSGPLTVFGSNPWYPAANCAVENVCLQLLGNSTKVPFRINIGNSNTNEKVVPLPPGLPSTFRLVKHIPQGYSDDYVYRFQGNNLIVRRVDHFGGWGAQTVAEISEGVQPHMSNIAFVRIEGGSVLNMSQLVVLDEYGDNISRGRPQQVNSETYGDANRTKANDGGEAPRPHPQEYHGRGADDLWQVQLAGLKKVSAVIVYNRSDCCQDRMASGFVIKLYAPRPTGGYMTVFVSNKLTAAPVQVIRTVDNNTGEKTVHGNNGTVTCQQYCHGPSSLGWGTGPWNGELPREWNGAKCVASSNPDVGCNRAPGNRGGFKCVCEKTGKGW